MTLAVKVSLNDCLIQGPSLTPMIFDIFLGFQIHKVAIAGHIEKAFLNIEIPPEQRDFLRFLWVNDVSSENPELIKLRFTRLVFGLTSSPFVFNAILRNHIMTEGVINPHSLPTMKHSKRIES